MDSIPNHELDHGQMYASEEAAARWVQTRARRDERFHEATEIMLNLANVQVGNRLLDVAAGTGDQTLLAARRVGPAGYVLATDISASMLEVAEAGARQAGLTNVETRVLDAQELDLPPASFDVAICRLGLMLIPGRTAALGGIHAALRQGGRLAAIVHAAPEKNPYFALPLEFASRYCQNQSPVTEDPGMFALGSPEVFAESLRSATFREVAVQSVPYVSRFRSVDALVAGLRESFPRLRPLLARLSEEQRAAVWAEITAAMGQYVTHDGVAVPGEVLVGVGRK